MTLNRFSRPRRLTVGRTLLALLLLLSALPSAAFGAPPSQATTDTPTTPARFRLTASQPVPALREGGVMRIDAKASVPEGTEYLEVRLRVFRPTGGLLHQKTEVRHDTSATVGVAFSRPLEELDMDAGRYPFELQMRATGSEPVRVEGDVLVYDPDMPPVKVAIVARFNCSPGFDAAGRFAADPGQYTRTRDSMLELAAMLEGTPSLRMSAAIPPVLLEEWTRIAGGYEIAGPEGLRRVPPEDEVPLAYAEALEAARSLAESPRVQILNVPYADPDIVGLQQVDGLKDLASQYRYGLSVYMQSLGTTPSPVTTLRSARLPAKSLPVVRRAGIRTAVLDVGSLKTAEATTPPGLYAVGSGLKVLAWDREVTTALENEDQQRVASALFDRLSAEPTAPVAAVLDVGAGSRADLRRASAILRRLSTLEWVQFDTVSQAVASSPVSRASLKPRYRDRRPAPPRYWDEVADARRWARGLEAALGSGDRDAVAARRALMIAESRCWAGPDQSWSLADRGRAFSASVVRRGQEFFRDVSVDGQDITLSGSRGEVPFSLHNGTDRPLRLRLVITGGFARFPKGRTRDLRLGKADNFQTIPIDLGSGLSDRVRVRLLAGDVVVAETALQVRGSYLDRVALVGTVALVLGAMLFFIRRRVRSADSDAA